MAQGAPANCLPTAVTTSCCMETGRRVVSQLGREAEVGPFAGLLTVNSEASTIVLPESARFFSVGLSRAALAALVPSVEDALVHPLCADNGALRLLVSYLGILDDDHAMASHELRRAIVTHIQDLVAIAIGATRDAREIAGGRGVRAARLRAIKNDILENLADDVSANALAARHRVTPRYIHKLFQSEGMTLSQYIIGQRLARAHRMLSDPLHAHRTIGALAFDVGFGDLSTFNRSFRRHFGVTPSDGRFTALHT